MEQAIIIDDILLDNLCKQAKDSPRLRMNLNFHKSYQQPAQKLLNAVEPGSVVPVHRHPHSQESYIVLRGSVKVNIYNADGTLVKSHILNPCDGQYGIEIPEGVYHNIEVNDRNTVIFEAKDGPYRPLSVEDILEL